MDKELAPAPGQTNIFALQSAAIARDPMRSFLATPDRGAGNRVSNRRGVRPAMLLT